MSKAPGDVAKAFLDALPTLDYNKLVGDARRVFGIVVLGDQEPAQNLIRFLRGSAAVPSDAKLSLWHHQPDKQAPVSVGKTELAIILPATEANLALAREAFSGVATMPVLIEGAAKPDGVHNALTVKALDNDQFAHVLLPALVDRLWERRLAVGRALPATRERIAGRMINRATRDLRVILGSVAGAGSERSGAPTPATAQLLLHQAVLVVSLAAVYGISLEDKRQIFRQVAPKLAPTVLLDGAEAGLTRLAAGLGKSNERLGKLYGPMTAYVARPTLSASSTVLAGLVARRVFRGAPAPGPLAHAVARTRALGKQAVAGAGKGAVLVTGVLGARSRQQSEEAPSHEAPMPEAAVSAEEESLPGDPPRG